MLNSNPCRLLAACLSACSLLAAQAVYWTPTVPLFPRHATAPLVADTVPGRVLLCGAISATQSGETWVWSEGVWRQPLVESPPVSLGHAMANDTARGRVVLFGAGPAFLLGDQTWEWDGSRWTRITLAVAPGGRHGHAMAYDVARARVVLFGGRRLLGVDDETWEYDGTAWTLRSPAQRPPAMSGHAMAYHAASSRVVLFGQGQTWTWDGSNWVQVAGTGPGARTAGLAPSSDGRLLLQGSASPLQNDTWFFDGTQWQQGAAFSQRPYPVNTTIAYDATRARNVLIGRSTATSPSRVFEFDGLSWRGLAEQDPAPPNDNPAAPAPSVFGGIRPTVATADLTWTLRGDEWVSRQDGFAPAVTGAAMIHDEAIGAAVLFGGVHNGVATNDTWEYRTGSWLRVDGGQRPPAYPFPLLAAAPYPILLIFDPVTNSGSTWRRIFGTWQRIANGPVVRDGAMVFDALRGQVFLFGGADGSGAVTDQTWTFDLSGGIGWVRRTPAVAPSARSGHAMAFDPIRGRVVLFGGAGPAGLLHDVWEWDGSQWQSVRSSETPPPRRGHSITYDPAGRRVVVFGGFDADNRALQDTWTLRSVDPAELTYVWLNSGCGGSAGYLQLTVVDNRLPWLGDTVRYQVLNNPWGQPAALLLGSPANIDLFGFGAPGCRLGVQPIVVLPFPWTPGGFPPFLDVPIPTTASLVGQSFSAQAIARDLMANALGLTTSNRVDAGIGRR